MESREEFFKDTTIKVCLYMNWGLSSRENSVIKEGRETCLSNVPEERERLGSDTKVDGMMLEK